MRLILLTVLFSFIFFFQSGNARILNVPGNFETINSAMEASSDSDTILVAEGRYEENLDFSGREIKIISNYLLDNDRSTIESTIIDGGGDGHVVMFRNSENSDSEINGFTLTGGRAITGGGIYCNSASPSLMNLFITRNYASDDGGGIFCIDNSDPSIIFCEIFNNTAASSGGGIYCSEYSEPSILSTCIYENTGNTGGGFTLRNHCNGQIEKSRIFNNVSEQMGGGVVLINDCDPYFLETLIAGNESRTSIAGGVYVGASSPDFMNVTISDNVADGQGGGIFFEGRSNVEIVNSIIWENTHNEVYSRGNPDPNPTFEISYCDIQGLRQGITTDGNARVIWGDGNLGMNPIFIDADNRDYHLNERSPCINSGDPDSPEDPDGSRADMGAFHFNQNSVYLDPAEFMPFDLIISEVYPNPFNSVCYVDYHQNIPGNTEVRVTNMLGQTEKVILLGFIKRGKNSFQFDLSNHSTGTYLLQLKSGNKFSSGYLIHYLK